MPVDLIRAMSPEERYKLKKKIEESNKRKSSEGSKLVADLANRKGNVKQNLDTAVTNFKDMFAKQQGFLNWKDRTGYYASHAMFSSKPDDLAARLIELRKKNKDKDDVPRSVVVSDFPKEVPYKKKSLSRPIIGDDRLRKWKWITPDPKIKLKLDD